MPWLVQGSVKLRYSPSDESALGATRRWQEVPGAREDKAFPSPSPGAPQRDAGAMVTNHLDAIPVHHPVDAGSTRDRFSLRTFIRIVS